MVKQLLSHRPTEKHSIWILKHFFLSFGWNRKICLLLAAFVASSNFLVFPIDAATTKTISSIELKQNKQSDRPLTWETILSFFLKKQGSGGSRGELLLQCAPTSMLAKKQGDIEKRDLLVWNNHPLFWWAGKPKKIILVLDAQKQPPHIISDSENKEHKAIYEGQTLLPGKTYQWQLTNSQLEIEQTFKTMSDEEHKAIEQDLKDLQEKLESSGASAEYIALQRANYFAEKDLMSDSLQEIFSVKNPSPALTQVTEKVTDKFCKLIK